MNAMNRITQAAPHVRLGAVARGTGVAVACLVPGPTTRSRVLFAAYTLGWPLDKPGLQVFVVVPDTEEPWKRAAVPFATSVMSWSTVMLVATTAVRRTRLPTPLAAVLLGGVVVALDSLLADLGERRKDDASTTEGESSSDTGSVDR
jgi:hypothetical protein